jgi:hypothetical protein
VVAGCGPRLEGDALLHGVHFHDERSVIHRSWLELLILRVEALESESSISQEDLAFASCAPFFCPRNAGMAIAAMMPMMSTTTSSSTSVKPRWQTNHCVEDTFTPVWMK